MTGVCVCPLVDAHIARAFGTEALHRGRVEICTARSVMLMGSNLRLERTSGYR